MIPLMRLALLSLLAAPSCLMGDGSSLDEQGVPKDHPDYPSLSTVEGALFPPRPEAIQQLFFNAHCTTCHKSGGAPKGLSLEAGEAFGALVGVPSVERPDLLRIDCGDPDRSYLILKLEGAKGIVGRQMPRRGPRRPQAEIDVLRSWIASGCAEI